MNKKVVVLLSLFLCSSVYSMDKAAEGVGNVLEKTGEAVAQSGYVSRAWDGITSFFGGVGTQMGKAKDWVTGDFWKETKDTAQDVYEHATKKNILITASLICATIFTYEFIKHRFVKKDNKKQLSKTCERCGHTQPI